MAEELADLSRLLERGSQCSQSPDEKKTYSRHRRRSCGLA
jgi:hypothetical protein